MAKEGKLNVEKKDVETLVKRLTITNDTKAMNKVAKQAEQIASKVTLAESALSSNLSRFLVNPNSMLRNRWDLLVIFALVFVAVVTPVEVAFLGDDEGAGKFRTEQGVLLLLVANRAIDVIFCIDIFLNFLTPYQTQHGMWITNHKSIAIKYISSWFLIDLVSVLPFEMLRMIRLLRLAKLLRIFRASRVLKRWETRLSVSYGYITLTKFVVYMLLLSHWLACVIRLVPYIEEGDFSWLKNYFADPAEEHPMTIYNTALYWAVMTVTTIGYGDVAMTTSAERWVAVFAMMVGGAAYAYIVGSVCGLVASMGEIEARLHRKIDDLNVYMEEQSFPNSLRIRLREYFHYTAKQSRSEHYRQLFDEMSPQMRGDVYRRVNAVWVSRIPFLYCASPFERQAFITALAMKLMHQVYPPRERICNPGEISQLFYIIQRGVVLLNKSYFVPPDLGDNEDGIPIVDLSHTLGASEKLVLTRGKTFGEDMILTGARRRYHCLSLTYVEVHTLSKDDLEEVFEEDAFPDTFRKFRRHVIKLAFRTKFVHVAKIFQAQERAMQRSGVSPGDRTRVRSLTMTDLAQTSRFDLNELYKDENAERTATFADLLALRLELRELRKMLDQRKL